MIACYSEGGVVSEDIVRMTELSVVNGNVVIRFKMAKNCPLIDRVKFDEMGIDVQPSDFVFFSQTGDSLEIVIFGRQMYGDR